MHSSAQISSDRLAEQIRIDIANKRIKLPTLPEVAIQVRQVIERSDAGADTVARVIGKDAALAARLLQVANSPLYPGNHNIHSLPQAVARLGLKLVRSLVTSLAIRQMFQSHSPALLRQFRRIWDDSLQIAALSRMLAEPIPELDNEQAMLGGLVHNIGALPILTRINECHRGEIEDAVVAQLIVEVGPSLGSQILRDWHFVEPLADIPTACRDLTYDPGPTPTYTDVVLVARLQHLFLKGEANNLGDWGRIPAFSKVGFETEEIVMSTAEPSGKIAEVRHLLGG